MSVTCVSCFYDIPSKYPDYLKWFVTTLRIQCPYVFFGTRETIALVTPFREGLPTIYVERPLESFVTAQFRDKLATDPMHCPSTELSLVWNEKIFMMRDAVALNPFQSTYFAWVDAGLCIYRSSPPPNSPFVTVDFLTPRFNYTASNSTGSGFRDHVISGTFVLPAQRVPEYADLYLAQLHALSTVYSDQCVWTHIFRAQPDLFHRVCDGYGTLLYKFYEDKVTVIIPTYNRFSHLMRTLASVRNQTYTNLEIIVVNDCSTQPEYYSHDWTNIRVVHLPKNSRAVVGFNVPGGYQRNFGLDLATGVYVAFCDDDDCWMPSKLEKQIAAMKDTGCGMSSTNGWMFHGAINTQVPYLETGLPKRWQRPFLSRTNYVICSSAVLRLDLGLRFAVMPDSEDYEMWKRVLLKTDLVYIDECLVGYDVNHGDGILYDKNYTPKRAPLKNWKMF